LKPGENETKNFVRMRDHVLTPERTTLQERLLNIVRRFPQRKLLILGDAIADRFLYGSISRVSREAPVFILRHEHTDTVPGGAANCAMNLASLGASVSLISVAGKDEAGIALREKLEKAGVDCDGFLLSEKLKTTTKERILAGQTHSSRQQVIRIDYEGGPLTDTQLRESIIGQLKIALPQANALIISDYNYGVANGAIIELVRELARAKTTPVLVDSRFRLSDFSGFTSATPNEDELEHLIGERIVSPVQLESAAAQLKQQLGFIALLVTRGSQGMMLLEDGVAPLHIKPVGPPEPVDGTGAGDTVIATFALALASDASFSDAARLANYAGGLVVMKRGTASVAAEELESSILNSESE
jgi:D-glycero-beta-D-manno-heptose-7-phosphate kinase